jgi:hypothetical protein
MKKLYTLAIGTLLIFFSCSRPLGPVDYIGWVEDRENGLKHTQSTPHASYVLQYEPPAYKALKSLSPEEVTRSKLRIEQEKYQEMHYFMLKIKPHNEPEDEQDLSRYLAYKLKDKLQFVRGRDTIDRTVMYHLESSAGVRPFYRILLAYHRKAEKDNLELVIQRNPLDDRRIHFTIEKSALSNIPRIQTDKRR